MKANQKRAAFLAKIPTASIELSTDTLAKRAKFNFSYFTVQESAGQNFNDLNEGELITLYEKLKNFSKESLDHWEKMPIGKKSGHVLEIYGKFPAKSSFTEPDHIPHQALWASFRIDSSTRLVGFVLPKKFSGQKHECGFSFDCNTFYVVFIDKHHEFYLLKK